MGAGRQRHGQLGRHASRFLGRTVEDTVATTCSKGGSAGLDITGISAVESVRDEAEGARRAKVYYRHRVGGLRQRVPSVLLEQTRDHRRCSRRDGRSRGENCGRRRAGRHRRDRPFEVGDPPRVAVRLDTRMLFSATCLRPANRLEGMPQILDTGLAKTATRCSSLSSTSWRQDPAT